LFVCKTDGAELSPTPALALFYRFIVRPMKRERMRTALTVLAVALGVAAVLAIELAGQAAVGSFVPRSRR